jgi:Tol biopolymer transport system component
VAEIDPQTGALRSPPKQITSSDLNAGAAGAAWSPDGESLAYYAWRGPQRAAKLTVVIRSTSRGEERDLSLKEPLNPSSHMPQWFPDSRSLFVHTGDGKLHRLDVQTGEVQSLLDPATVLLYRDNRPNPNYSSNVILSADGRSIYYLARDNDAHQTRILQRGLDGGQAVEICRSRTDAVYGLGVSPDGSRLVFSAIPFSETGVGPKGSVWTVATTGGEPKEVYRSSSQYLHEPVWSRDGRRLLVFCGYVPGDICIVPAEGGEAQPMGVGLHEKYFLGVHPDGNQIVFADEQWNNRLWVLKNLFADAKSNR